MNTSDQLIPWQSCQGGWKRDGQEPAGTGEHPPEQDFQKEAAALLGLRKPRPYLEKES